MAAFSEAYIAASQSGKSTLVKRRLGDADVRAMPRWLVWDFKREYQGAGLAHARSIAELCDLAAAKRRAYFQPSFDDKVRRVEFDRFCRVAIAAVYADRVPTLAVVEELSFVTTPSWAPGAWRQVTCTGLGLGLSNIGTSQHPAQIDKSYFGNTTAIYCGRLTEPEHVEKMARVFGCPAEAISGLPPFRFLCRRIARPELIETVNVKKPRARAA